MGLKRGKAVTLLELILATVMSSILILSVVSINSFSRNRVLDSERRTRVQNELSLALDFITKYAHQANGDKTRPPFEYAANGLAVNVDFNPIQTPSNAADDSKITVALSGNTLRADCVGTGCPFVSEVLSNKLISGYNQAPLPSDPTLGLYVLIPASDQGTSMDIGVVGRYTPLQGKSPVNPEVVLKTKIICPNASSH